MATVAQFDITYTQFLNEHGKLVGQLPSFAHDHSVLKELYKIMVLTILFFLLKVFYLCIIVIYRNIWTNS